MKEYEKFDLQKALAGEQVMTTNGNYVIEIGLVKSDIEYPVYAVLKGGNTILSYTREGRYKGYNSVFDLVHPIKEKWISLYWVFGNENTIKPLGYTWDSEADAIKNGKKLKPTNYDYEYFTTVRVR